MFNTGKWVGFVVAGSLVFFAAACATVDRQTSTSPVGFERDETAAWAPSVGPIEAQAVDPVAAAAMPPVDTGEHRETGRRIENPLSDEEIRQLQDEAARAPVNDWIQLASVFGPSAPVVGVVFESLDFATAGGNYVPPDPELAVGPNHTISVVNDYLLITDTLGATLVAPNQFANFFNGVAGCSGMFDPNVLYDEELDRFIVGVDANATAYCVGMSQTSDPTLGWWLYSFATVPPSGTPDYFDYPHAGVGDDAIFMGANIYNNAATVYLRSEVWAIDKTAMASGSPLPTPVKQTVTTGFTPQPMNAHGFNQGTWPAGQPHFVVANSMASGYSGDIFDVWAWSDPFGANTFGTVGSVDLAAASGVPGGYPFDAPQSGGGNIQSNDWRILDCEYRNGDVWMTQNISCNPGSGNVDCIRWAEIDPATPSVRQVGVLASNNEYRIFPDAGVNHCDDMTMGYTKTSAAMWPAVWLTGRLGTDPVGILQSEALLRPGDIVYSTWETPPMRWGDYTGGTSDPDGVRTWYLGEYSKFITPTPLANWGTYVGEFTTTCAVDLSVAMGNGTSQVSPGEQITYTATVTNNGRGDAFAAVVTDFFPADLTGVTWTCTGQAGPPAAVCSTASGSGNINPLLLDIEVGATATITATGTVSQSASGTLANTLSANYAGVADPVPSDNAATDTDTVVPKSDLGVHVNDGNCYVLPGGSLVYTVTMDNTGPANTNSASISDTVPSDLTVTSWSCTASGSASCGSASGSGPLSDSPSIPVGDQVTYSVNGTVSGSASGQLVYTVSSSPPAGAVDPVSANNSHSDTNGLELPVFCDDFEIGSTSYWSNTQP